MSFVVPIEIDNGIALVLEKARELGADIGERIGREGVLAGAGTSAIDVMLEEGIENAAFRFGLMGVPPTLAGLALRETQEFAKAAIEKFRTAAPISGSA